MNRDSTSKLVDDAIAAKQSAKLSSVTLTRGCDLTPTPIAWLWRDWLALGKFHVLAGAPGTGKTTLAMAMAATVTSGGRWPDGTRCDKGNVLVWSGEDDPSDTLLPRLIASGADPAGIYFVTGARIDGEAVPFDPARDLAQLTAQAESIGSIRMLIVDPVVGAVTGDSHKNGEVRRGLQPLVDLGSHLNASVLGISHFSKGSAGRDPTERVTGSVAFGAVARVVMVAAKVKGDDGEDRRIFARSKSNVGRDDGGFTYTLEQVEALPGIDASRVLWGAAIEGTARELLTEPDQDADGEPRFAIDEAADALIRIIGRDMVPSRDVTAQMKAERFSEKVIRSARERIGVIVKRSGFGKEMSSYWKLPDSAQVPDDDPIHALETPYMPSLGVGINGPKRARMDGQALPEGAQKSPKFLALNDEHLREKLSAFDEQQVHDDGSIHALPDPFVPIRAQPAEWSSMGTTDESGHECEDAEVFE